MAVINHDDRVCFGKVGFESPALARKAAKRKGAAREYYRCGVCGLYHVGNRARSERMRDRRPVPAVQRVW